MEWSIEACRRSSEERLVLVFEPRVGLDRGADAPDAKHDGRIETRVVEKAFEGECLFQARGSKRQTPRRAPDRQRELHARLVAQPAGPRRVAPRRQRQSGPERENRARDEQPERCLQGPAHGHRHARFMLPESLVVMPPLCVSLPTLP
jgi:hypothetical protein